MNYLLDANTFIEAKNRYYSMTICPGYWQWLLQSNKHCGVSSIEFIKKELINGNDELAIWAKEHPGLFESNDDEATQLAFANVVNYVMSLTEMKDGTHEEFLRGADPWLIAKAITTGSVIVTHEKLDKKIKRKILIPNICEHFKVSYINTFELLNNLEAKFVMHTSTP
ncbi:DUF4411 family protein [Pseudoalteromonas shioyasakiensis]|uniref:DUF4411 family protein n=1 Tax=Pseudoalteromonas shioyasakiensis TaxID=1190813 RepID=UPI001EFC3698|nr:DUF4411 family protein [Pseudoalteromonas shioyasakiensis]MCG9733394.1 DUF4411 family protein [Pseudoalteromonas shioyasakiensis]